MRRPTCTHTVHAPADAAGVLLLLVFCSTEEQVALNGSSVMPSALTWLYMLSMPLSCMLRLLLAAQDSVQAAAYCPAVRAAVCLQVLGMRIATYAGSALRP
jgi:hypothetical protein